MHHFYTLLAIDLANERSREAQHLHELRHVARDGRRRSLRRRLTDSARGVLSMLNDSMPTEQREPPRLPAGHTH